MSAINVILDELAVRLGMVSVSNGYLISFNKITRARLSPFKDGDLPACNYWVTSDMNNVTLHGAENHTLSISIESYDKTRDRPFIDVAMDMHAAIVTALNKEIGGAYSQNLGGIVQSLEVKDFTPIIGEGQKPWCGALVNVAVNYQTKAGSVDLF